MKLSELINIQDFKPLPQAQQQEQPSQKLIVTEKRRLPEPLPTLKPNNQPKVRDCLASQIQLTNLLFDVFQGQKRFGETVENMDAKANFFKVMLADYSIEEIQNAFFRYAKTKPDIPAPADIIQLIENPPVVSYDDVVCSCGKHYGIDTWTPEKRAKSYSWHRKMDVNYTGDKKSWLEGYETEHGTVQD